MPVAVAVTVNVTVAVEALPTVSDAVAVSVVLPRPNVRAGPLATSGHVLVATPLGSVAAQVISTVPSTSYEVAPENVIVGPVTSLTTVNVADAGR